MNIDYELTNQIKLKVGNKYDRILSILLLIEYRTFCSGIHALFGDETSKFKNIIKFLLYILVKLLRFISNINFNKFNINKKNILLSNTFWQNPRYASLLLEASCKYSLTGFFDKNIIDSMFKNDLFSWLKLQKFRNIGINHKDIFDSELRKSVTDVYNLYDAYKNNLSVNIDKLIMSIDKMNSVLSNKIEIIKKILLTNSIADYITINQFNLFDQLIIISCNELNIKTKNLIHYLEFADYDIMEFTSCRVHLLWCEENANMEKKFSKYVFGLSPKKIESVGCPEVTFNILSNYKKNNVKKSITLFVPDSTYMYLWGKCTRDEINASSNNFVKLVIEMWFELFKIIHQLALKYGFNVIVKYHPGENAKCLHIAKEFERKFDFIRSNNFQNSLYDICSKSIYSFGYNSSALYIARVFGNYCFNIKLNNTLFSDLSSYGIQSISINELQNLELNMLTKKYCNDLCFSFIKAFK